MTNRNVSGFGAAGGRSAAAAREIGLGSYRLSGYLRRLTINEFADETI